jgi:hypothetical protein
MSDEHDHDPSEVALRVRALETLLTGKGYVTRRRWTLSRHMRPKLARATARKS